MELIVVNRVDAEQERYELFIHNARRPIFALPTNAIDHDRPYLQTHDFFTCRKEDVEAALTAIAQARSGCEVAHYTLASVGTCPAAPFVMKKVTEEGILPQV